MGDCFFLPERPCKQEYAQQNLLDGYFFEEAPKASHLKALGGVRL